MAGMREIQIFDVPIFLMPIVGFRFRAYAYRRTLRALKAQLKLRERRATPFIGQVMQGRNRPWSSAHYP